MVDLPEPLSPARPKTSPLARVKLTSLTAFTSPLDPPNSPPRIGNALESPTISSSGSLTPPPPGASRPRDGLGADRTVRRRTTRKLDRQGAARREAAAGRRARHSRAASRRCPRKVASPESLGTQSMSARV